MPSSAWSHLPYRVLAAVTAIVCALIGVLFIAAFCDRALFQVFAHPLFETNYWGYYLVGFSGAALLAWAGCLVAAVRRPAYSSGIGAATAGGLIVGAIIRLLAWYSGEYRLSGAQLQLESAVLILLALGFVWLRPPRGTGV